MQMNLQYKVKVTGAALFILKIKPMFGIFFFAKPPLAFFCGPGFHSRTRLKRVDLLFNSHFNEPLSKGYLDIISFLSLQSISV